jgi:hypothetical protein
VVAVVVVAFEVVAVVAVAFAVVVTMRGAMLTFVRRWTFSVKGTPRP